MMKQFPKLETERLKLVHIDRQFTQPYFDIMSMDTVTRYYGMESLQTMEEAGEVIDSFQAFFRQNKSIRWGIVLKETNDFIGTIGLNNLNIKGKKSEIGFELHPDHWRKGIISEAVEVVLRYAFTELDLCRMGAVAFPENTASNSLLKKMGFKQEGKLRGYIYQHGKSNDVFVYSMLKPEWEKTTKKVFEIEEKPQYVDYMSEIIKKAERDGHFDDLPGKGKPLDLGYDYFNPPERQLYKTMKDNHILPRWVELGNEIEALKEELATLEGKAKRKVAKEINKKVKEYNFACPPSLQRNRVEE